MDHKINYYEILGVSPSATAAEIRHAFRMRAMKCHPDRGGSHQQMVLVCEAAEVLLDAKNRSLYDQNRREHGDGSVTASWNHVREQARAAATQYPKDAEEFFTWLNRATSDVQQNRTGRLMSGFIGGILVGSVFGAIVGWWLGIGPTAGLFIGVPTVGVIGAIAGAMNPIPQRTGT